MIYVVSGYMRSGTSMMMQALAAGGLNAAYAVAREVVNERHSDARYRGNREGLWEIPFSEYESEGFPRQYDGRLIKVFLWGLTEMVPVPCRVVLMRRDAEEIRQSYEAFLGEPLPRDFARRYDAMMDRTRETLAARPETVWHEVAYREAVVAPLATFTALQAAGWPIDAAAAAAVVRPEQCRFRREILVEGI